MSAALVRRRVLVVDDDPGFRSDLAETLSAHFEVDTAARGDEVLPAVIRENTEVVLLDYDLGAGPDGLEILELLQGLDDPPRVIMLTGNDRVETVVACVRAGAADYVCKPVSFATLCHRIERCLAELVLVRKTRLLAGSLDEAAGELVAEDPLSRQIARQIARVAPTDATVLITGESGTGKEMVARRIHQLSRRSGEVFLAVNCTAISPTLMESTLFGHERGAFTGASDTRAGQFELADGGTLFLDEVGDSPPELQQKLLRVLESGQFQRVGGSREISTDVRLVAATNADLERQRDEGRFRHDLYHRLNVYRIHLAPLRDRPGDILPLAERFLMRFGADQGKALAGFSEQAQQYLLNSRWPGNVRDLRNAVERAVINCDGDRVGVADLAIGGVGSRYAMLPRDEAKKRAEREFYVSYLSTQLALAGGSVKEAARLSGILPQSFSRLCREYGVGREKSADQAEG
jgi:DNA-binding NtrC family response regulator